MRRLLPVAGLCLLAACAGNAPRKYVVFFSAGSTELDDNARNVLLQVAEKSKDILPALSKWKVTHMQGRTFLPMRFWPSSAPKP